MKHLKTYNESVKDYLKPKSKEDLKKLLDDMVFPSDKLTKIINYKLFDIFTKEEVLKLFKRSDIETKRNSIINFSALTHFTKTWKDKPLRAGIIYGMDKTECEEFFKNVMLKKFYKNDINESVRNFLKPKPKDELLDSVKDLTDEQKLFKGIEYELDWLIDLSLDNLKDSHSIPLKSWEHAKLRNRKRLNFTDVEKKQIDNILKDNIRYEYDYLFVNGVLMYSLLIKHNSGDWNIIKFDRYITVQDCKNSENRDGYFLLPKFEDLLNYLNENKIRFKR